MGRFVFIGILFSFVSSIYGDLLYRVTDLGDLPGGENCSRAYDINNHGQIVGESMIRNDTYDYDEQLHAFLWENGNMVDLGDFQGGSYCMGSSAYGINDNGQVVGKGSVSFSYIDEDTHLGCMCNAYTAFLWENGQMYKLDDFSNGYKASEAYKINNQSQIVGSVYGYQWDNYRGYFLEADEIMAQADFMPEGDKSSGAYGVNNQGQVVGWTSNNAFVWDNINGYKELPPLGNINISKAHSINDDGIIAGYSHEGKDRVAIFSCVWEGDDAPQQLDAYPDQILTYGYDINNYGQVVGVGYLNSGSVAMAWINDSVYNLNTLLDSTGTGWSLGRAYAINDSGLIVGTGINPDGYEHGFLLTPLPEPMTINLVIIGGIFLRYRLCRTKRSRC